ncbi:MAG: 2,4-dienoyl-CoA reductase, partial [Rhodoferax sp.]|nr:2,4-dienoyl-CoA reductase [Rhodoferax sp.]
GQARDGRTLAREAYFLEFASEMVQQAAMPLMVTGGIRRQEVAETVLEKGVAMVGMATAMAYNPTLPREWKQGRAVDGGRPTVDLKDRTLAALATMAMVKRQLQRMGAGKMPKLRMHALWSLVRDQIRTKVLTRRYRYWLGHTLLQKRS